jgi:hypothetical protein
MTAPTETRTPTSGEVRRSHRMWYSVVPTGRLVRDQYTGEDVWTYDLHPPRIAECRGCRFRKGPLPLDEATLAGRAHREEMVTVEVTGGVVRDPDHGWQWACPPCGSFARRLPTRTIASSEYDGHLGRRCPVALGGGASWLT